MDNQFIYPERNDDTLRLSALSLELMRGKYLDSQVVVIHPGTGEQVPVTSATYSDGKIVLSTTT